MTSSPLLAHPDQSLVQHLLGVARRAEEFATHFQGEVQAQLAGLLHDLGKADAEFQKRITKAAGLSNDDGDKRPHAYHGAALALEHQLWPVAFAINGHHAGLHNRSDLQQVSSKCKTPPHECENMIKEDGAWAGQTWPVTDFGKTLPAWLEEISFTTTSERDTKMRAVDFYTRMIFSALVDADRLDTENANLSEGSQKNTNKRKDWRYGLPALAVAKAPAELIEKLNAAILARIEKSKNKGASHAVMEVRAKVLEECQEKAQSARGVFSLSVPTGGGKTLASIAFALNHIQHHNKSLAADDPKRLRRIIVVLPFLNIIQQTTKELREVFAHTDADPIILEHHSQATDPVIKSEKEDADGYDKERPLRQLATENWDAPIIVTTSVQFFDSLFSRRPADARKLHNICQSVIIFDEVQTLPPFLLQPILDALKELTSPARPYGCSAVLCTATQPALGKSEDFEFGFENVTPLIDDATAKSHFEKLKRVEYHGLSQEADSPPLSHEQLVDTLVALPSKEALVIFNTRKQARTLFDVLKEKTKDNPDLKEALFHLSTWMYPAHRLAVLEKVSERLDEKKPCFLISTQCVEAGVDVDFPAVWRAFGPYDSIVQAAGRCNRSGSLPNDQKGQVHIFIPEENTIPSGTYESAIQTAQLLRKMGKADPHNPDSFRLYFNLFYQTTVPDPGGCAIQSAREKLHFKEVSEMFHLIDSDTAPLLIGGAEMEISDGNKKITIADWVAKAKQKTYFTSDEWRMIQPYIVNLNYPAGKKITEFIRNEDCELVFKDDDPLRGLRLLKAFNPSYKDGLHDAGLKLDHPELDTNL